MTDRLPHPTSADDRDSSRSERTRRARVLLTDLSRDDGPALLGQLRDAGFDAILASGHTELCLNLLTWQPDAVVAREPIRMADSTALARLIRRSAQRSVAMIFVCRRAPEVDLGVSIVLEPVVFAELERVLQALLAGQSAAAAS